MPLRMIGLTRKSRGEDEGTHVDQRAIIERRAESEGFDLIRVEKEHQVSGAKSWKEREFGQAIEDVKAGRADGVIVAYEDRVTRERMLAAAEIWTALEDAGAVFVACDGVDSRAEGSEMLYAIKAAIAREQWRMYQKRSNDGRRRAVEAGVHGGDEAPVGYDFTKRADGSRNGSGAAKHGPLYPNEDCSKVVIAFMAMDAGGSWADVIKILGVKSQSVAAGTLRNRVYLGEASSGEFVKEGAHHALVDVELFNRVQRKLDDRARARREHPTEAASAPRIADELAGVMRCAKCAHAMTPQRVAARGGRAASTLYRCMYRGDDAGELHPEGKPTIGKTAALPVVLGIARDWHRRANETYWWNRKIDDAMMPVLVEAEDEAVLQLAEVEALRGKVSPAAYAVALSDAQATVIATREARVDAEAAEGWIGMSPEAVEERLAGGDPATVNSFLREMVRIMVAPSPYGQRFKCPVKERIWVQYLGATGSYDPLTAADEAIRELTEAGRQTGLSEPGPVFKSEGVPDQPPPEAAIEAGRKIAAMLAERAK